MRQKVANTPIADLLASARQHQNSGQWQEATEVYEAAFRLLITEYDLARMVDVVIRLADGYGRTGEFEVARDVVTFALTLAELHPELKQSGRAYNNLGSLEQRTGATEAAERAYRKARALARGEGERRVLGEVEQNLGILYNIRGDHAKALRAYCRGLSHLRAAGYEQGIACALNNLGMLHVDLGRLPEAERYFQRALEISEAVGDAVTVGAVQINRTELYLAADDLVRARDSCDAGFEIASRLGVDHWRAEALKFYGSIYRATGKIHLAEIHLLQAIDIAAVREPLLEAEAQRELSLVLRELGRNRDALRALNRAHALFSGLQAHADTADIHGRIGQLEEDFLSLVRFWGESIEAKDRYTGGHCARVADYACRIAEVVGFPEGDLGWFRMGAYLHDIGKVEVSAEILNKPGRLTDEERALMERHTVIGDEMLSPVEFPWDIRPMVRSHHERWDGTGYPDGIAGEAIHYSARILRMADVFDALTTARSYREPLTPDEAYELMENDEGSFDPDLFDVFRSLFPELAPLAAAAAANPVPVGASA
jgi:putative nucleotidyltransferase with HDIG domain